MRRLVIASIVTALVGLAVAAPSTSTSTSTRPSTSTSSRPSTSTSTSASATTVAVFWQPPGAPPIGASARAAFAKATAALGARLVDASTTEPAAASLRPALDAAKADHAAFAFAAAIAKLDALARLADAQGGGDLDRRQLSEIFLYRGLSRLETGAAEAAWDDLIRAARLDSGRVIDPAAFPPRAVAAYRRAVTEVAALPRAELEVVAPGDAVIRVDGAEIAGLAPVMLGQHFVSVSVPGFEPWAGVATVAAAHERLTPRLRAYQPPDGDRTLGLAPGATRLILGALERAGAGWRFMVRDIAVAEGRAVSDAAALGSAPVEGVIARLLARVGPQQPSPTPSPRPRARTGSRWWVWAGIGAATVFAVTIAVRASSDTSSGNTVGGTIENWP